MPGARLFIIKLSIFCLPVLAGLTIYTCYYYIGDRYQETINGREIYWAIKKCARHKKVKKLLVGDSVAQQLFDSRYNNDSIYSITSNQAISCAGYYLLLKSFLDNNRDSLPGQVILIIHPLSLQNNLDQVYTFHYFLEPFFCEPYKQYFSPTVNRQVRKIPFYYLSQFPFIKVVNWSPDYRPEKPSDNYFLSPINMDYLARMKSLCDSLHVPFAIVPPPVSTVHQKAIEENWQLILDESIKINMQSQFSFYLHTIRYMDKSLYSDEIHFYQPDKVDISYIKNLNP